MLLADAEAGFSVPVDSRAAGILATSLKADRPQVARRCVMARRDQSALRCCSLLLVSAVWLAQRHAGSEERKGALGRPFM